MLTLTEEGGENSAHTEQKRSFPAVRVMLIRRAAQLTILLWSGDRGKGNRGKKKVEFEAVQLCDGKAQTR